MRRSCGTYHQAIAAHAFRNEPVTPHQASTFEGPWPDRTCKQPVQPHSKFHPKQADHHYHSTAAVIMSLPLPAFSALSLSLGARRPIRPFVACQQSLFAALHRTSPCPLQPLHPFGFRRHSSSADSHQTAERPSEQPSGRTISSTGTLLASPFRNANHRSAVALESLSGAIRDADPVAAWQCYLVLVSPRLYLDSPNAPSTNPQSPLPSRLQRTPKTRSDITSLPTDIHSPVLQLMKMTTNRVFSARHRVSLPISIIVERVQFIVTNMKLHGVQLSESDFLALVDLYARARNIGAMEASFRDFALAYPDSYLSIEAANSVLSGYVGAHRVQDAARWYDSMVTKFALRPNHFTYSLLMAMYGRTGDLEALKRIFIAAGGVIPPLPQASSADDTSQDSLLSDCKQLAAIPRPVSLPIALLPAHLYATLIAAHGQAGNPTAAICIARSYLQSYPSQSIGISPLIAGFGATRRVLTSLIQALCKSGHVKEAEWILLNHHQFLPAPNSHSSARAKSHVLQALYSMGRYWQAHHLGLHLLGSAGVKAPQGHTKSKWWDSQRATVVPSAAMPDGHAIKVSDHGLNFVAISTLLRASNHLGPKEHAYWLHVSRSFSSLKYSDLWRNDL